MRDGIWVSTHKKWPKDRHQQEKSDDPGPGCHFLVDGQSVPDCLYTLPHSAIPRLLHLLQRFDDFTLFDLLNSASGQHGPLVELILFGVLSALGQRDGLLVRFSRIGQGW